MTRLKKNTIRKKYTTQAVLIIVITFAMSCIVRKLNDKKKSYNDDPNSDTVNISDRSITWINYVLEIEEAVRVKPIIIKTNEEQKTYNTHILYRDNLRSAVIVVSVHNAIYNLDQLIFSLQKVTEIENSLIIFAHIVYDVAANVLIEQKVTFARYIQIFYPYSTQLYPIIFPGPDPTFCSKTYICVKNKTRNFMSAQDKHFWWWKMNYIFDYLHEVNEGNEYVMFIDEDNYVFEDFIYMMKTYVRQIPSQCYMICLGCHTADQQHYKKLDVQSIIEEFGTTNDSMALAFNRTTWKRIKKLRQYFCQYNDSWYNTLIYLSSLNASSVSKFTMISSKGPRVLRMGKCINTSYPKECTLQDALKEITTFLDVVKPKLYPKSIIIEPADSRAPKNLEEPGHLGDVRDQDLCLYIGKKQKHRF